MLWQQRGFITVLPDYESRHFQEEAYRRLQSIEFRYRKRYNLPPTDPRYLNTTLEEMIVDDWTYYLSDLRELAVKKKLRLDKLSLDVLLDAANEGEDIEQGLEIAMMKWMEKEGETPPLPPVEDELGEREPVIRMEFDHE